MNKFGYAFLLFSFATQLLFSFATQLLYSQNCADCRYTASLFDSVVVSNVVFGEEENADGDLQELSMDIYEPFGDTLANRPVMIFAFGGGFIQGSKDQGYVQRACERFAKAGYVAVAIDYRIGFDPFGLFPVPTEELMRVFFRAMQDMRGAIQWLRAHEDQMGNTFRIDPERIIAGGASAGGITSLMVAYCDKSTEFAEIGDTNAIAGLGGFYSSTGNFPGYSWEVAGVFNIAGGIVNTDWIEPGDPPIFNAHGDVDLIVPYAGGNFGVGPISIGLEGSYNVDQAAGSQGVCSYLYTLEGQGHPMGNEPEEYYDQIFNRATPRAKAILEGLSFCCNLQAAILPSDTLVVPAGQPAFLSAAVGGGTATSIQWCMADCQANGMGNSFSFTPTQLPAYALLMVRDSSCLATDFALLEAAPVGRTESLEGLEFDLFPQPAGEQIWFRWDAQDFQIKGFRLFNLAGQSVWENSPRNGSGGQLTLDWGKLPSGWYNLEIQTNKGQLYRKLAIRTGS